MCETALTDSHMVYIVAQVPFSGTGLVVSDWDPLSLRGHKRTLGVHPGRKGERQNA